MDGRLYSMCSALLGSFGSLSGFFGLMKRRKNIPAYREKNSRSFEEVRYHKCSCIFNIYVCMYICVYICLYACKLYAKEHVGC